MYNHLEKCYVTSHVILLPYMLPQIRHNPASHIIHMKYENLFNNLNMKHCSTPPTLRITWGGMTTACVGYENAPHTFWMTKISFISNLLLMNINFWFTTSEYTCVWVYAWTEHIKCNTPESSISTLCTYLHWQRGISSTHTFISLRSLTQPTWLTACHQRTNRCKWNFISNVCYVLSWLWLC